MYVMSVKMAVFTLCLQKNHKKNLAIFPHLTNLLTLISRRMNARHSVNKVRALKINVLEKFCMRCIISANGF